MRQEIAKVMTRNPVTLPHTATLFEAARQMAHYDIGDVVVTDGSRACGLVTDRDIVVRALANGLDPRSAPLADLCRHTLVSIGPTDTVDDAIRLMTTHAIRRVPVIEDGRPVGMVSLGDLAGDHEARKALATISSAPSNH